MRIKVTQFSSSSVYLLVPFRGQEMDISFFLCAFTLGPLTPHHYGFCNLYSFTKILKRWFTKRNLFLTFPLGPNPNYFFPIWILIVLMYWIWETSRNKSKKYSVEKIVLTFHRLNKLFWWSQRFCKFSAFSLEFQKFFLITRTIFSHSRSEQFW